MSAFLRRSALVLVALVSSLIAAKPVFAQDEEVVPQEVLTAAMEHFPTDCLWDGIEPDLRLAIADDKLADRGLGEPLSAEKKEAADEAHFECVQKVRVPLEQQCDFFVANYAEVISRVLHGRLTEVQIDLNRVEELVSEVLSDPNAKIGEVVVENPEFLGRPIEQLASERDMETSELVWWILDYVAARYSTIAAKEAMRRPESVCGAN